MAYVKFSEYFNVVRGLEMCRSILIPMMISTLLISFYERSMECETGDRARVGGDVMQVTAIITYYDDTS